MFPRLLYGSGHPYGRHRDARVGHGADPRRRGRFHKKVFLPNNAALIVAGDTTPDAITAKLEEGLRAGKPARPRVEPARAAAAQGGDGLPGRQAGAAQSVLAVGQVGVPRSTPDYFPLSVMNEVLGGQFSSRINLNLREDKGYTYGARSTSLPPGPARSRPAARSRPP